MSYGNAISTADAQKINQVLLGQYTPTGFDFYSMDVNGNNSISVSDVYSVFGNISSRFTKWPNGVENLLFFTKSERDLINGSSTSLASTIPGVTNFTHYINGGSDSILYYVVVKGDANSTGYKMARLTPIRITNPANANQYIIDNTVQYDNVLQTIEINMPKVKVEEGNLVNIPVKVLTSGKSLSALQLDLKYDPDLLEFKKVENSEKAMKWITYLNPLNGIVSWGGFDLQNNNMLVDGEQVFNLQFIAKKPQNQWGTAAIWTGEKYVGDNFSKDMNIIPTMGIVEVLRVQYRPTINPDLFSLIATPNPNDGNMMIGFNLLEEGKTEVSIFSIQGQKLIEVIKGDMPKGEYLYSVNTLLSSGIYYAIINNNNNFAVNKIIITK
jgi:hypothetical protein